MPRTLYIRTGWQGALVAASLNATMMPLDLFSSRTLPGLPVWAPLGSSATGLVLVAVLIAPGTDPPPG